MGSSLINFLPQILDFPLPTHKAFFLAGANKMMGLTTEGPYSFINYQLCNYVDNYSIQDMDEQVCVYIYIVLVWV